MPAHSVRALRRQDVLNGSYLRVINQLSAVEDVSQDDLRRTLADIEANSRFHKVFVAVNCNDEVVGGATLLIEPKFTHQCRSVAHVEDVVVDQSVRRRGIGRLLVEHVVEQARLAGCRKILLSSALRNARFYELCGGFAQCRDEVTLVKHFDNK